MQAIGFDTYGGPDVLHPVDLPEPHAGPGEIRIAVRAAGVAPVDAMLRRGDLAARDEGIDPPFVPGIEVAGIVDEVGPGAGAQAPAVGEAAVAFVEFRGAHGGYSDFIVVPAASATRAPRGVSMPEAGSFLMNALTARNVLDALALEAGASLLVVGAAGTVGGYLTQLASGEGVRVIGVASSGAHELVRSFGATDVVARGEDAFDRVRELIPGGVDAVADTAALGDAVLAAVRDGGQVAGFQTEPGQRERGITVHRLVVFSRARDQAAIVALRDQVEAGELALRVQHVLPATEAVEAHRLLDAGGVRGRIVLSFPV